MKATMTEVPRNLVTRVAEAAMDRAKERAREGGGSVARIFVCVHVTGNATDEPNTTAAAGGDELDTDWLARQHLLLELAMSSVNALAETLGYQVELVSVEPS